MESKHQFFFWEYMLYSPLGTETEKKLNKKGTRKVLASQDLSVKSNLYSACINQVVADKLRTPIAAATT